MDKYSIIEDTTRFLYSQAVWSHKVQEKQAEIYNSQFKCMETISIICASLTSVGVLAIIFNDNFWIKIISAVLSFVTVFVAAYFKSFDLKELARDHKAAATKILCVRNDLLCLLASIKLENKSIEELEKTLQEIKKNANKVYREAPQTSSKALRLAKISLQVDGDNSFTDDEIDRYLPDTMHKSLINESEGM